MTKGTWFEHTYAGVKSLTVNPITNCPTEVAGDLYTADQKTHYQLKFMNATVRDIYRLLPGAESIADQTEALERTLEAAKFDYLVIGWTYRNKLMTASIERQTAIKMLTTETALWKVERDSKKNGGKEKFRTNFNQKNANIIRQYAKIEELEV